VGPPVLVLKIGATGRADSDADDIRIFLGVEGPGMASLQPPSMCWLINCSGTGREHIGLWLIKATVRTMTSRRHQEAALPSDCDDCIYISITKTWAENRALALPVLAMAILVDWLAVELEKSGTVY